MKRRVFTSLSALSLALCVATCALWMHSYWRRDHFQFTRKGQYWELATFDARFFLDNQPQIVRDDAERKAALSAAGKQCDYWQGRESAAEAEFSKALQKVTYKHALNSAREEQGYTPTEATKRGLEQDWSNYDLAYARVEELRKPSQAADANYAALSKKPAPHLAVSRSIPTPAIMLPLMILPALAYRGILNRRMRKREGRCLQCGYDLRPAEVAAVADR